MDNEITTKREDLLSGIFEDIQSDLNIILSLNDKMLKVRERFDPGMIGVILNKYYFNKVVNNCFANCVLMGHGEEKYWNQVNGEIKERFLELLETDVFKDMYDPEIEKCGRFIMTLLMPLMQNMMCVHRKIISQNYNSIEEKLEAISIGKIESLSVFFSFISFLYGFRFVHTRNKQIFYMQPYFEKVFVGDVPYFDFVLGRLAEHCEQSHKGICINISYRFCNKKYVGYATKADVVDKIVELVEQFSPCSGEISISFPENTNMTRKERNALRKIGVVFDNTLDEYEAK